MKGAGFVIGKGEHDSPNGTSLRSGRHIGWRWLDAVIASMLNDRLCAQIAKQYFDFDPYGTSLLYAGLLFRRPSVHEQAIDSASIAGYRHAPRAGVVSLRSGQ
ncbi:hypothetical protein BN2475_50067 [Paraburkholderia ribeironis]|uniref:Uncharacterized protein n=1 Tax=Paraburkholderia ribeironis TaxID=1247936 RepID=A0A1N7RK78_9BURK|nr:hypothetical protein BN2475_50067 [Paraburkholderia ribeironis]